MSKSRCYEKNYDVKDNRPGEIQQTAKGNWQERGRIVEPAMVSLRK